MDKSVEIQQLPAYHVRVDSTLASLHLIIRQYTYALKIADNSCSNKRGLGLVSAEIHAHVYHSHRLRVAFGNEFLGRVRKYLKDKSLCCHTVAQDITPVPYCPGAVLGNDLPAIFLRNVDVVKNGEFLIIEFGHNDQKIDTLDAFGGYTENLKYFVNFVREKGANPIICSPINRIIFQEDGTLLNLLGDYRTAVKNVCDEMNVPFIDLWSRTTEFFEAAGAVKAWDYFWGNGTDRDYTHTNDIGGNIVARFVANEMIKNNVQPIADLIKKDMINVEMPKHDSSVKPQNSKEIEHLKTIGLVNVPKASELADLDKDITNI